MRPIKTKSWAIKNGYTHHGTVLGVPVWLAETFSDAPLVCAKNWLADIALDIGDSVMYINETLTGEPGVFTIVVKQRINKNDG